MDTVCPGRWSRTFQHEPKIVKRGDPAQPGTSHGYCEDCAVICHAEMDGLTGLPLAQYAAYLSNPTFDPRD